MLADTSLRAMKKGECGAGLEAKHWRAPGGVEDDEQDVRPAPTPAAGKVKSVAAGVTPEQVARFTMQSHWRHAKSTAGNEQEHKPEM